MGVGSGWKNFIDGGASRLCKDLCHAGGGAGGGEVDNSNGFHTNAFFLFSFFYCRKRSGKSPIPVSDSLPCLPAIIGGISGLLIILKIFHANAILHIS